MSLTLLSYAEVAIGIIVSCIPTLPRFFRYFGPRLHKMLCSRAKVPINRECKRTPTKIANAKKTRLNFVQEETQPDEERPAPGDGKLIVSSMDSIELSSRQIGQHLGEVEAGNV